MLLIASSQLHPNVWMFVRSFEVVMEAMRRKCSLKVFFTIFEVCRRRECEDDLACFELVALRSCSEYALFKPYTNSQKRWNHKYFCIVLASQSAIDVVGNFKFSLGWSEEHSEYVTANYVVKPDWLSEEDQETLDTLKEFIGCKLCLTCLYVRT